MTRVNLSGTRLFAMRALWEQRPLIERAKAYGADVLAVDQKEDASAFEIADHHEVVADLRDLHACYEAAIAYDVDAVVADQCDYSLFATSYIGDRLELPAVSLDAAQRMTNKKWMRKSVSDTVAQPEYKSVRTLDETRDAASTIGYPCILKPVDNRGGFGVSKVNDSSELAGAFYEALENSHAREVLIERFVEGVPVSIDGYHLDGEHVSLAIGSKNTAMGSLHPNLEITYPAQLSDADVERVVVANNAVADALGVEMGATHAEYILTDEDAFLLEFQNRGGGIHTSARIVPAVTGFNVMDQLLADAVGQRTGQESEAFRMENAAVMRFLDFEPGHVDRVESLSTIRDDEDVLTFRLYFEEGDKIEDFSAFTDSHGVIIGTGATAEDAVDTIDRALSEFKIAYQ